MPCYPDYSPGTWLGFLVGTPASARDPIEPPLSLAEIEDGRLLEQFHSTNPNERATALRRAEIWGRR